MGVPVDTKAILISESDGEANPYYFFNSIIIPGEWRGTQAFHFLEPTSWKSAMNLDTVAGAREWNREKGRGQLLGRARTRKMHPDLPSSFDSIGTTFKLNSQKAACPLFIRAWVRQPQSWMPMLISYTSNTAPPTTWDSSCTHGLIWWHHLKKRVREDESELKGIRLVKFTPTSKIEICRATGCDYMTLLRIFMQTFR